MTTVFGPVLEREVLQGLDFTPPCAVPHGVDAQWIVHTSICGCVHFVCDKHLIAADREIRLANRLGLEAGCAQCGTYARGPIMLMSEPIGGSR